jgi:hypothetical protein
MKRVLRWFLVGMTFSFVAMGQLRPELLLLPVETNTVQRELLWSTEPGIRYELQSSTNLETWTTVDGFPTEAAALAQQHVLELQNSPKGFFRVLALDEQPPVIAPQSPTDGAFAVPRFSTITVDLSDTSASPCPWERWARLRWPMHSSPTATGC